MPPFNDEDKYAAYGLVDIFQALACGIVQFVLSCLILRLEIKITAPKTLMQQIRVESLC